MKPQVTKWVGVGTFALLLASQTLAGSVEGIPDHSTGRASRNPVLRVEPLPNLEDEGKLGLQRQVAEILSRIETVPQRRLSHFKWLDDPRFRIKRWHAYIEIVDSVPGGYLVTLRVRPLVNSTFGAETAVRDYIIEKYLVTNGVPRLVDMISPPGTGLPSFYTF